MEEDDDVISSLVDLYCHEDPLVSTPPPPPTTTHAAAAVSSVGDHQQLQAGHDDDDDESLMTMMAEYMERQRCYAPSRGYVNHLITLSPASSVSDDGVSSARSRGVHYIIYAFGRLGLAAATAFNAVNYLDRFLSINCHLQSWETWMVELMEEAMSHSFRPATIQDMELTLLKALQWRLACVTPFSFLQLLLPLIACTAAAASRCTRLLIRSLSETSVLRFDPSVIASSALRCVVLQDHPQADVSSLLISPECPLDDKDTDECFDTMEVLYESLEYWSDQQMYSSSDQQRSPISVFPFGTDSTVNRSTVSRCLFGRSILQVKTEDEDSIPSDTQNTRDEVISHM